MTFNDIIPSIALLALFAVLCLRMKQSYEHASCTQKKKKKKKKHEDVSLEEEDEELVGVIYPPRLGPLQTNIAQMKSKMKKTDGPFTAIYKNPPYLRQYHHGCQPMR